MLSDKVSDYFDGVAAKYLRPVDANPNKSNQHEIGGLPSAGFMKHLGTPQGHQKIRFTARQIYISDDSVVPEISDGRVTWYDVRSYDDKREPEYRLYYYPNSVTELISEGDFLLIAKLRDNSLLMIFTPADSTVENQLRLLFGLGKVGNRVSAGAVTEQELYLPLRLMLEDIGVPLEHQQPDESMWLEKLIREFGSKKFPTTQEFSIYARSNLARDVEPISDPDSTLIRWMDHEEKLFRVLERYYVQERLRMGFGNDGEDVDGFISYSLSVQNRRKSRVGHAFEGHLDYLFTQNGLQFEQGRGKGKVTENNSKPDFMFPGFSEYQNSDFCVQKLFMLGAKTTCKDRWRQVLTEAHRIPEKHLITLEPAISEKQTNEMRFHGLQLVLPTPIHNTYSENQRGWLMGLSEFIAFVKGRQVD